MTHVSLPVAVTACHLFLCISMAPLLHDISQIVRARLSGRPGPGLGRRWRLIWSGLQGLPSVAPPLWGPVGIGLLVATALTWARLTSFEGLPPQPLALGILLLAASWPSWIHALAASKTKNACLEISAGFEGLRRDLVLIVPLLFLIETVSTIKRLAETAPSFSLAQGALHPGSALSGSLVFLAASLFLLLEQRLLDNAWLERSLSFTRSDHRVFFRFGHDMTRFAWYYFLADLTPPVLTGSSASAGLSELMVHLVDPLIKIALIVLLAELWRLRRLDVTERLSFVLAGTAILTVLTEPLAR